MFSLSILSQTIPDSLKGIIVIDKERVLKSDLDLDLYVYYYAEANQHYYAGHYKKAYKMYSKLFDSDPYNYNFNYRLGLCFYKRGLYNSALYYFSYAAECINPNYLNSIYENGVPPIIFSYLGDIYCLINADYPVEFFYKKYLEYITDENIRSEVELKIKNCKKPWTN
jgi:tetratricopeptide (TPR) repeat protein